MKNLKTATEINNDYKLQKKLENLKIKQKEKIEKQQLSLMRKREIALEKAKNNININYEKKMAKLVSNQIKIQKRLERKILWKKPLKSLEKKISFSKRFDDLLYFIQKFVRLRDTWPDWYGNCITCWKRIFWKNWFWWHAITRKQKRSAYLEECINLQCYYCNWPLAWNYWEYRIELDKKYGKWTYDRLKSMKWPLNVNNDWIKEQKKIYKQKIKQLLDTKNNDCK